MTISYEKKYLAQEALLLWDIRKNKNRIKKNKKYDISFTEQSTADKIHTIHYLSRGFHLLS